MAARAIIATLPRDGTVMGTFNSGVLVQSVTQPEIVNIDFRKYVWIGVGTPVFSVCYGYGPNGVKTWDELMHRKQVIFGSTGKGSLSYINMSILRDVFAAPVKLVLGYPGSSEVRLAIERGELDGDCGDLGSIPADWLHDGRANPFVRFTRERPPEMSEQARFIEDFATTQDQKDVLGVLDAANEVGRAFVMAGGVPADLAAIMRKAFEDTMKDPAFLAGAEKEQLPVHPLGGEEAAGIVAKMMTVSPAVVAEVKKIFE